jgi:hypothetical protein
MDPQHIQRGEAYHNAAADFDVCFQHDPAALGGVGARFVVLIRPNARAAWDWRRPIYTGSGLRRAQEHVARTLQWTTYPAP